MRLLRLHQGHPCEEQSQGEPLQAGQGGAQQQHGEQGCGQDLQLVRDLWGEIWVSCGSGGSAIGQGVG